MLLVGITSPPLSEICTNIRTYSSQKESFKCVRLLLLYVMLKCVRSE